MGRLLARVHKLKGRSLDELRVRGVQAVRARLERLGLSDAGCEPTDASLPRLLDPARLNGSRLSPDRLLEQFRARNTGSSLFAGLADRETTAAVLRSRWPSSARDVVATATRVADGFLDLFGREVFIGAHPDWALDPHSGRRAPSVHWSRIAYLDPSVAGDCKVTWELNRHQYFVTLGRAYWLTGDERYARAFTTHLASWIHDNPPKRGINWASSLEVSFRAIAWIWALHLFRDSMHLDGALFARALKLLYVHARHIETYLSTYFSPNTHLTGEALGLFYVGCAFPEFRRAETWRALGSRILEEELERQVLPDGVYFEQASYYHRYTTDFYLHALLLAGDRALPLADAVRPKLTALLEYLLYITRPNGSSPLIGDDDGGRLLPLDVSAANDFRGTIAAGAVLLARGDLAHVAGRASESVLWLLGPEGVRAFDALSREEPQRTSVGFETSGYFVMRDDWSRTAHYAILRCGPHGAGTGAHAHADALAVEIAAAGRPLLVDPGTYTYTAWSEDRAYFRGGAAHNTVTVDGQSSSVPSDSPFVWRSVAGATARTWLTHAAFDFFEGEHDGYTRLDDPAIHSRWVLFLKGGYWVIGDHLRSDGAHQMALHFHWAADIAVRAVGERAVIASRASDHTEWRAQLFGDAGRFDCEQGWLSTSYGVRTAAPTCTFRRHGRGAQHALTVLGGASAIEWERCAWHGATAGRGMLTVALPSANDTLLIGGDGMHAVAGGGISSDARWAWIRRSPSGQATELVLIRGQTLVVDGEPVLSSRETLECAVGRRTRDGWQLDVCRAGRANKWNDDSAQPHELCAESAV